MREKKVEWRRSDIWGDRGGVCGDVNTVTLYNYTELPAKAKRKVLLYTDAYIMVRIMILFSCVVFIDTILLCVIYIYVKKRGTLLCFHRNVYNKYFSQCKTTKLRNSSLRASVHLPPQHTSTSFFFSQNFSYSYFIYTHSVSAKTKIEEETKKVTKVRILFFVKQISKQFLFFSFSFLDKYTRQHREKDTSLVLARANSEEFLAPCPRRQASLCSRV